MKHILLDKTNPWLLIIIGETGELHESRCEERLFHCRTRQTRVRATNVWWYSMCIRVSACMCESVFLPLFEVIGNTILIIIIIIIAI